MRKQINFNECHGSLISDYIQVPEKTATYTTVQAHNRQQNNNFIRCSDLLVRLSTIKNICNVAYYCSSIEADSPFLQSILKNLCYETQNLMDAVNV